MICSTGLVHYNTEEANKFVHLKTRVKMSFFFSLLSMCGLHSVGAIHFCSE